MRRNSSNSSQGSTSSLNSDDYKCSLCYDYSDTYYTICHCSNQNICERCIYNLELNRNFSCPYCRSALHKSSVVDFKKRREHIIYKSLCLLFILIIQIGFPFCIMAYFDNKEKLSHDKNDKEILNNSLLVSILLPICVLIIQPVNFVLHFIYTRLWLNHKCYKNLLIISGCYTIFICLILLITNTILVYQYIFFFLIILLYLIPFAVGVLYLFYKYLKYHADQINIDNFSYERIRILGSTDNRHRYLIDRQERRNRRNIGNEITNHETNHESNYESNYEFNTRSPRMLGLRNNRNSIELLSPDDTGITFNGENDNDLFITHTSNSSNSSNNSDNSNQVFYLVNSTVEREINPDELNETYRDNGVTDSSSYLEGHENSYA